MGILVEVSHHLWFGLAGPVLPTDKSFILLLGDGYIAGYFIGSVFLPDVGDLQSDPDHMPAELDAEVEIWRRRWGIALALLLVAIWVVGKVETPDHFTLAPSDHDLFSAIPLLGIGGFVGALCAPVIAKRLMNKLQGDLNRLEIEHKMGVRYERALGTAFVCVYIGVWLNPW